MGNQVVSQRALRPSDHPKRKAASATSYLSKRSERSHGTRRLSFQSFKSVREHIRSMDRALDNESAGEKQYVDEAVGENEDTIRDGVEQEFELPNAIDGMMQRNLCGCRQAQARVDLLSVAVGTGPERMLYVDRLFTSRARENEIVVAMNDLKMMCYLTERCEEGAHHAHPNVVEFLGHFSVLQSMHILTKYYEHGSLMFML